MKKATIQLETLSCPSCLLKIEKAVKALEGVQKESVLVLFHASKVKLLFDDQFLHIQTIEQAIRTIGYDVKNSKLSDV